MPTVKNIAGPFRFYFYSFDCNESRHVHVQCEDRLCKFWLEPVTLAKNDGFSARELTQIRNLVKAHLTRIMEAWHEHCN